MSYQPFISLFFILISISTWTNALSQGHDATALFQQGQISNQYWWTISHADSYLLIKSVNLQHCLDEQNTLNTWQHEPPYSAGIWIHPRSIRTESWRSIWEGSTEPFNHSVGFSMVPYVEIAGEKFLIAPHFGNNGRFDTYYAVCDAQTKARFHQYPHYYPTMMLNPMPTLENQAQRDALFNGLLQAVENEQWLEVMAAPYSLTVQKIRLDALLKGILTSVDHIQFLKQLYIPFQVDIKFVGFGEGAEGLEGWRYQPIPYQVKVQLPNSFIQLFENAEINLLAQMRLKGCEPAQHFNHTPAQPNVFLTEDCYAPPTALLITGFDAIPPTHIDGQNISFRPEDMMTTVSIATALTYYLKTPRLDNIRIYDHQTLSLSYQEIGQDLQFRVHPSLDTKQCDITQRISLADVIPDRRSVTLAPTPVPVQWLETIAYHADYVVYQYPDKAACRNGANATRLNYYTPTDLPNVKVTPCAYLKLVDEFNDEPASRCTQPVKKEEDNQWVVDFKPYQCGDKRQLIVVSTGEQLDNHGGKRIPQTITKVLQNLQTRVPFTLVTIKPGRELSEALLQCEDLGDLDEFEAKQLIRQQVLKIRFGATDLRALADLNFVNLVYPAKQLHSVFYITDNSGIPTQINRINDKDLSVPLITWKRAGVQLTVLTTGLCEPWKKRAEADKCEELQRTNVVEQIRQALEEFLVVE